MKKRRVRVLLGIGLLGGVVGIVIGVVLHNESPETVTEGDASGARRLDETLVPEAATEIEPSRAQVPASNGVASPTEITFHVEGADGEALEHGFLATSSDGLIESRRAMLSKQGRAAIELEPNERPPYVMIGADRHCPIFIRREDPRWTAGQFEVELESEVRLEIVARDLVDHASIPGARVHAEPIGMPHRAAADMPAAWRSESPVEQYGEDSGSIWLRLPSSTPELRVDVLSLGYYPARQARLVIRGKPVQQEVIELAPLVVGGLELRTGDNHFGGRPFGWLETLHDGDSPVKASGPPDEQVAELKKLLQEKVGEGCNVYWEFASLRPGDALIEEGSWTSRYRYRPFTESEPIEGVMNYKRIRDISKSDLVVVDLVQETARRIGRLEVEFEGVRDPKDVPRGGWVAQATEDPNILLIPRLAPVLRDGHLIFPIDLGSGRYRVRPNRSVIDRATFDPVEVDIRAGETRRLLVPMQPDRTGELNLRIEDVTGALDVDHARFTIQEVQGGPVAAVPFIGETRHVVAEGRYTLVLYVADASESMPVEIKRGQPTSISYRRKH